jgi:Tfp pilus assembly protein PilF
VLAARISVAAGDGDTAERLLRQVLGLDASNTAAYGMLAQVLVAQGKLDQARAGFDEVYRRNPQDVGAATMAAMILDAQSNGAEARKRYTAILARHPRAGVAANNLAWMMAEEGRDLDEALALARTAVEVMPNRSEALDTLGWVYYRQELPALAIGPFERSIAGDANNPVYHYHFALALARSGETARARRAVGVALQLKPDYTDARRLLDSLPG